MDHDKLKAARETLGLTAQEMADMLDLKDPKAVNRWESPPDNTTHRPAPVRVSRLIQAYLAGYRPDDWPERLRDREARMALLDSVRT